MTSPSSPDKSITCPRCGNTVSAASIRCTSCGVNLALAVARAATERLLTKSAEVGVHYEADRHLPRFGEFLIKHGDITEAQLQAALARQAHTPGQHRTLGQILLEMGAVSRDQLDKASMAQVLEFQQAMARSDELLAAQSKRIRQLESALAEMASLNLTTLKVLDQANDQLQAVLAPLTKAKLNLDEDGLTAVAQLNALAVELQKAASQDR